MTPAAINPEASQIDGDGPDANPPTRAAKVPGRQLARGNPCHRTDAAAKLINEEVNDMTLEPSREAFARCVVEGLTKSDALRKSYRPAAQWKPQRIHEVACRWAREPKVHARISALREELARQVVLEQVAVIRQIHAIATADIRGIVDEHGRIKLPHQLDAKTAAGISKFKMSVDGTIEYVMHSKVAALDQACKILGLYERDNRQNADPLTDLLRRLSGHVIGVTADARPGEAIERD